MSGFLDDREHAAENLFAHNEELLFLAHRAGVRDLAHWAADEMGLEPAQRESYATRLIDTFVSGVGDAALVTLVGTDLERAGKGAAAAGAASVLAQAVARASAEQTGRAAPSPSDHHAAATHVKHPIGASLSWCD